MYNYTDLFLMYVLILAYWKTTEMIEMHGFTAYPAKIYISILHGYPCFECVTVLRT
jgi:hypothetical protein